MSQSDPAEHDPAANGRADHDVAENGPPEYDAAEYVEAVLDLVERIPPGRVISYGAIAEALRDRFGRGSARRVGTIMAQYGAAVPWHRVVASSGRLPPGHEAKARRRLEAEGVKFRGPHVDMAAYAWPGPAPDRPQIGPEDVLGSPKANRSQDRRDPGRKALSKRRS